MKLRPPTKSPLRIKKEASNPKGRVAGPQPTRWWFAIRIARILITAILVAAFLGLGTDRSNTKAGIRNTKITPTGLPSLSGVASLPLRDPTLEPIVNTGLQLSTSQELPVLEGTPLPKVTEGISPSTAAQVALLAQWEVGEITQAFFTPDGNHIGIAGSLGISLYDRESLKLSAFFPAPEMVTTIAFHPNGKILAIGSQDNTIRLWDITNGQLLSTLRGYSNAKNPINTIAISPDGKTLASGSADKTIALWDLISDQPEGTLSGHLGYISGLAFSPNGSTLASGSGDNTVILWDVATWKPRGILKGHKDQVNSIAFSPDGGTLASGSADRTVILWDVASGLPLHTLSGHLGFISNVAFSPSGTTLASASGDHSIMLWEVTSGRPLQTLKGYTQAVQNVAFSPDGELMITSSNDGTIRLWGLPSSPSPSKQPINGIALPSLPGVKEPPFPHFPSSTTTNHQAWDISNVVPTSKTFYLGGQGKTIQDILFSSDGTKMYGMDESSQLIFQYTLYVPWDISTAVYSTKNHHLSKQITKPSALFINPTGTEMYLIHLWASTVFQYKLTSPWDITTASNTPKMYSFGGQASYSRCISFSLDGTKMYIGNYSDPTIYQYVLTTPWDITTAFYSNKSFSIDNQVDSPGDCFINPEGTRLYLSDKTKTTIYQYHLSTPWDISTAYSDGVSFGSDIPGGDFSFSLSGSQIYIFDPTANKLIQYMVR